MSQVGKKRDDPVLFLRTGLASAHLDQQFSDVIFFLFQDRALALCLFLVIANAPGEFDHLVYNSKVTAVMKDNLGFPISGEHLFPESDFHLESLGREFIGDIGKLEGSTRLRGAAYY